jgi:hypothetical protein
MTYTTADQMFEALAAQVSDEEFVMRAVKTAFPEWKRDTRTAHLAAERAERARRIAEARWKIMLEEQREKAADPDGFNSDHSFKKMMADGSAKLLAALHAGHPRIMSHLSQQAVPVVVYP